MKKNKGITVSSILFYIAYLAASFANVTVIFDCIHHTIDYYYGSLLFLPIFIASYWIELIYESISAKDRITPRAIKNIMSKFASLISLSILAFWFYAYFCIPESEFKVVQIQDFKR